MLRCMHDLPVSADAAASRAYYAAFYAVSALFAARGQIFSKHSAVEAAVHRELVRSGHWPQEHGKAYSRLSQLRARGDYGGGKHVEPADAEEALAAAHGIVRAVSSEDAALFSLPPDLQ